MFLHVLHAILNKLSLHTHRHYYSFQVQVVPLTPTCAMPGNACDVKLPAVAPVIDNTIPTLLNINAGLRFKHAAEALPSTSPHQKIIHHF